MRLFPLNFTLKFSIDDEVFDQMRDYLDERMHCKRILKYQNISMGNIKFEGDRNTIHTKS